VEVRISAFPLVGLLLAWDNCLDGSLVRLRGPATFEATIKVRHAAPTAISIQQWEIADATAGFHRGARERRFRAQQAAMPVVGVLILRSRPRPSAPAPFMRAFRNGRPGA
jgi:hypothetical protein